MHRTPLHSAIAHSKTYDVSRVLLEHGGDLHNRNADGKTPLHTFPSQVSEHILRCQESLLDFSDCDHRGMSLLHYLAWSSKTSGNTFKKYHQHSNYDISAIDAEGRSMLHLAAQRGNVPVIDYIVCAAKDFDINHKDCRGRTALHYGVESRRACDTITALILHGADIWARDCHGRSALHHATKLGNLPAVEVLSAFDTADALRTADCFGSTLLNIAAYHKDPAVLTCPVKMESRWRQGRNLTGPDLAHCKDPSTADTDNSLEESLSRSPTRTLDDAFSAKTQNLSVWTDGGWLNILHTYCSVINSIVVILAIWTLAAFLFQ